MWIVDAFTIYTLFNETIGIGMPKNEAHVMEKLFKEV